MKTDRFVGCLKRFYRDESGITGLETAIILIAFIVVAAVFAFTIMTTGLFSTEKAKTTAQAGISEASSTFAMKGGVTGQAPAGLTHISSISFQVTLAAGAEDVDITLNRLAFTYTDSSNIQSAAGAAAIAGGAIMTGVVRTTITGTDDNLLASGEVVQFTISLREAAGAFTTPLVANTDFRIEIIPSKGGSLILQRRTPVALKRVMNLD